MMHCGERKHVWAFVPVGAVWPQPTGWTQSSVPYFVCVGGHNGKGCGATMSVSDAAVALTSRQNCGIELAEARQLARLQNERANHSEEDAQIVGLERDEARGIANELFDAYREFFNPKARIYFEAYRVGDWSEVGAAYGRIRPEVRAKLEGK